MSDANAVATVGANNTAVATYDYGEDAGAGFENVQVGDFKPSFLRVLQPLSPQVVDEMPGAKAGLIVDSITNEYFENIDFVPACREHVYVAWKPRNEGGGGGQGFGGLFQLTDPMVLQVTKDFDKWARDDSGKMKLPRTPDGEFQLIETIYFHGMQKLPNGGLFPATLPFFSTGLPVAQTWLNLAGRQIVTTPPHAGKQMPLYAHYYRMGSAKKKKDDKTWFIPTLTWGNGSAQASRLAPDSAEFLAAKEVAKQFREGRAKVDYAASGAGATADEAGKEAKAKKADADIPF